jgi:dipeptidyl aminopeptidase/acylaminoacyl peptidase
VIVAEKIFGVVLGALLLGGDLLAAEARAQAPEPLPIETALGQPSFTAYTPLLLSPGGEWVAYSLHFPTRAGPSTGNTWFDATGVPSTADGGRVRITELRTGHTLAIGDEAATNWGPSWSPDGRYLVFCSNADGKARLWVRETATGHTRRVSDAIVRGHRSFEYPRWTPDSRSIVVPILPYGSALPEAVRPPRSAAAEAARERDSATVTVMRADPAEKYGGQLTGGRSMSALTSLEADLALVNVVTGAVATLAHGYYPLEYEVAPNGRFLVFTSQRPPTLRQYFTHPSDVLVVGLGASKRAPPRLVAAAVPLSYTARSVLWSPDGATLLYSVTDSASRTQVFAADSADWRPRRVAPEAAALFESDSAFYSGQAVWWDESGRAIYGLAPHGIAAIDMPGGTVRFISRAPTGYEALKIMGPQDPAVARSDGGRSLTVAIRNESSKRMGFARVDLATGTWRVVAEADEYLGERRHLPSDVGRDGRMVYVSQDAGRPPDIWTAGPGFESPRQLTHLAPEMERIVFGASRLIAFTTADGSPRRATLLLPARYQSGQRYPLVVYPYPVDTRSNDVNVFGVTGPGVENMQLLATRGFAVLTPDVAPFDYKDQMRALASIVQRAVDRAIELGVADSTRLGIMGHSWGGYTTLATIVQTNRFGAAVMRGGEGDEVTTTGILQAGGFASGLQLAELLYGATPWERPELFHRNSPIYLLDRVRTPLLIVHGEAETTVPVFLADQIFAGLQRLGKEVEYARYANENHVESGWSPANQRDYLTRMIGWFESHLKLRSR